MSIVKERIKGYIESIEYDSNDFIKNVIIGQHVYSVLTYQYLLLYAFCGKKTDGLLFSGRL